MDRHRERMRDFVGRLWQNPSIRDISPSRKENQILSFVKENARQLQSALSGPDLFAGLKWEDTVRLLNAELSRVSVEENLPILESALNEILASNVLREKARDSALGLQQGKLLNLLRRLLGEKSVRDQFGPVAQAMNGGLMDRYLASVYEKRGVIFNEMIRRDHATLERPAVIAYMKMCAVLRPLYWYRSPGTSGRPPLESFRQDNRQFQKAKQAMLSLLIDEVGDFPTVFFDDAVDSARGLNEGNEISGSARFLGILVARAQELDPLQKRDRGAETPDKSWFSINRRAARYYGYDIRFLEEFYQVAGEKGW